MLGLMIFMRRLSGNISLRFDWLRFAVLALGIGAFQMMLDRGELKDWFSSKEVISEAVLAGVGFYLFIVHLFTAEKPVIPPAIHQILTPDSAAGAAHLNQLIDQQAQAIAYLADFKLMMIATLPIIPVVLMMRRQGAVGERPSGHAAVFE